MINKFDYYKYDSEYELKKELKKYILSMKENQCYRIVLKTVDSTVKLLEEFEDSEKDFLILKDQFYTLTSTRFDKISLIVTKNYHQLYSTGLSPTMTELKLNSMKGLKGITCKRLKPIINNIIKDINDNKREMKCYIHVFDTPFTMKGQTPADRTNYGWQGPYFAHWYGDTTSFLIVGYIMNESEFFHK